MDYDTPSSTTDRAIYNSNKRRGSASSISLHINKSKSLSYPKSPRLGGGYPSNGSAGAHVHNAQPDTPRQVSASTRSNSYNTHHASHPSSYVTAPHPTRSPSSSSSTYNSTTSSSTCKSPVEVKHGKRPGQIWLPEGVVDMTSFGPILDMDETDATREFSKALVWAWCDQAEMALEEMEMHLAAGNIVPLADKAHYLKGSSASLGLVKVSSTCQSIYHTHFPPSLAHLRAFSYTGKGNSELSSKVHSSGSGSSGSSSSSSSLNTNSSSSLASPATPYSSDTSMEDSPFASFGAASDKMQYSLSHSPRASPSEHQHQAFPFEMTAAMTAPNGEGAATTLSPSPGIYASHGYMPSYTAPILSSPTAIQGQAGANPKGTRGDYKQMDSAAEVAAHFERMKLQRAGALLAKLRLDVKQGSEWLYTYYRESDKFAGVPCYGI